MNIFEILYLHGLIMRVEIRRELSLASTFLGLISSLFSKEGKNFIKIETERIETLGKLLGLVDDKIEMISKPSGDEVIDDLWGQIHNWQATRRKR